MAASPPQFFFAHFPKILIRKYLLSRYTSRSLQNIEPQALTAKIFQNKGLAEYFAVELPIFFIPWFAKY